MGEESTSGSPVMQEIPIFLSERINVYSDAIEALNNYKELAGISFVALGTSQAFLPQTPTVSSSALSKLSKIPRFTKLVNMLEKAGEQLKGYIHTRYSSNFDHLHRYSS
ncbi:hypothetical protein LCGC14_2373350 [marine sediment metagenome]|uniref:Uncharacterized protein n=1 Tax=marine sediment metagenome TaxID=412755 RepID=A0A0F9CQB9_9ZZZZ